MKRFGSATWLVLAIVLSVAFQASAVKVQDLVRIKGSETNTLVGTGLVVGLNATGDGGDFKPAMRALAQVMKRLIDPNVVDEELENVENVALVSVTAVLPKTGVREGDKVDIRVASIGPAESLLGGRLFMTPMIGPVPGSPVYAFGEGPITIENIATPNNGVIKNGASIVRDVRAQFVDEYGRMTLVLDNTVASWSIANTIASIVNDLMAPESPPIAFAEDQKNVVITIPESERINPASFITQVLEIHIESNLVRTEARVVMNERTGTIVVTGDVELSPVVISHEGLTITTVTPAPVANDENPQVTQTDFLGISVPKDPQADAKLEDLLNAFNQLKVPAADRIAILKEIYKTGRLHAKMILED